VRLRAGAIGEVKVLSQEMPNQDLKLLEEIGLVTLEKTKADRKSIIPHVDYTKIMLEIPV
jgi:predicted transcriptional regulator